MCPTANGETQQLGSDSVTSIWQSPTIRILHRHRQAQPLHLHTINNPGKHIMQRPFRSRAGTNSTALDDAYPVNAFGDHFLTDAFSAGHLINKEYVMKQFIANVLTGGKVNSAGDRMFERIADGAHRQRLLSIKN